MDAEGNPLFGNKMQLYCNHRLLSVKENGEVEGTSDTSDPYTHLEISSGESIGTVKIKGILSNYYVRFDDKGKIHGEENPELPGTTFKESIYGSYNCYESNDYPGWFLGINRKGLVKNGKKTQCGKKSTKFLPRRID